MFARDCRSLCGVSIDDLVIFFRGMIVWRDRGEEQVSLIEVVVHVVVDGGRIGRCDCFSAVWPSPCPGFHRLDNTFE